MFEVLTLLAATAIAQAAPAPEPGRSSTLEPVPIASSSRIDLAGLFPRGGEPVQTRDGVNAAFPSMEVVVARIGPDGRLILACVDNEREAQRFLDVKTDSLRAASPAEK